MRRVVPAKRVDWVQGRREVGGAPGQIFLRGTYQKFFSAKNPPPPSPKYFRSVYHFRGKKNFRTSALQLLSRDFISFSVYAKFRYLAEKNKYLVLCAEIFNTQKRLGPNKNFSGAPRDELKHAITWEMLTCRAGLKFGGNDKIINTTNVYI